MTGRSFNWSPSITTGLGLDIAKGNIPKHETGSIFGRNDDIDPAAEEMIWDHGGFEVYLTANTELFLSSTDAADTNVGVFVWGMTDDFVTKRELHVFTSGQAQQSIGDWFRVFRIVVVSGDAPLGDLYCAQADTLTGGLPDTPTKVHLHMLVNTNTTHKASITIPADHTMYIVRLFMAVRRGEDAVIAFRSKMPDYPAFIENTTFPVYQSETFLHFDPPFVLLAKMDFEFSARTVTNNTQVTVNAGFIMVDNRP